MMAFLFKGLPLAGRHSFPGSTLLLFGVLILPLVPQLQAQSYDYNKQCRQAHQALLAGKISKAEEKLSAIKTNSPDNLIPYYLAHYRDFLQLYMYGNPDEYKQLENIVSNRLDKLDNGPESSPYHSFTKAEVRIIWSLLQLREGDYLAAGMDLFQAYKLYKTTANNFPDFWPAQRVLKAIHGVVGTLPGTYQWIVERFGIKGDLQRAIKTYPSVTDHLSEKKRWQAFHRESLIIFSYMQYHLMDARDKAWQTMKSGTADHAGNHLSCLLRANMALNLKKGREALDLLKPYQKQNAPIPYLDYLLGSAMLYDLQPESRKHLKEYITNFKGGTYVKDTYLQMGWAALLKGDTDFYHYCQRKLKEAGSAVRATDRKAVKEADHYNIDNRYLLKARLRYDGGYFKKAWKILANKASPPLNNDPDLEALEYYYRMGRVQKALNKKAQALKAFDRIRELDASKRLHYYLPAANLQAGLIHEDRGATLKAKRSFNQVLEFSDYPFEKALSQKAKAGLKRVETNE